MSTRRLQPARRGERRLEAACVQLAGQRLPRRRGLWREEGAGGRFREAPGARPWREARGAGVAPGRPLAGGGRLAVFGGGVRLRVTDGAWGAPAAGTPSAEAEPVRRAAPRERVHRAEETGESLPGEEGSWPRRASGQRVGRKGRSQQSGVGGPSPEPSGGRSHLQWPKESPRQTRQTDVTAEAAPGLCCPARSRGYPAGRKPAATRRERAGRPAGARAWAWPRTVSWSPSSCAPGHTPGSERHKAVRVHPSMLFISEMQ